MLYEETIRDPIDNVQWRFILIPKFRDGMGAIVMKTHHGFTDGGGGASFFLALSGQYDCC